MYNINSENEKEERSLKMNGFERFLWNAKVNKHRVAIFTHTLFGKKEKADKEYGKVERMFEAYDSMIIK